MKIPKVIYFTVGAIGVYYGLGCIGTVMNIMRKKKDNANKDEEHDAYIETQKAYKEAQDADKLYTVQKMQHDNVWFMKRLNEEGEY